MRKEIERAVVKGIRLIVALKNRKRVVPRRVRQKSLKKGRGRPQIEQFQPLTPEGVTVGGQMGFHSS